MISLQICRCWPVLSTANAVTCKLTISPTSYDGDDTAQPDAPVAAPTQTAPAPVASVSPTVEVIPASDSQQHEQPQAVAEVEASDVNQQNDIQVEYNEADDDDEVNFNMGGSSHHNITRSFGDDDQESSNGGDSQSRSHSKEDG